MYGILNDLRFTWRLLGKGPGSYLTTILILVLGLGISTAIFSIASSTFLRPLPYPDADELSLVLSKRATGRPCKVSLPDLRDFRERSQSFTHLAAYRSWLFSYAPPGEAPVGILGAHVTGDFFATLGLQALHGRLLDAGDDQVGGPRVAVLAAPFWRRYYDSDPGLVGRTIQLDGVPHRVVGIAPDTFLFTVPEGTEIWTPLAVSYPNYSQTIASLRDQHLSYAIGRRKRGADSQQAADELNAIAQAIAREHPGHANGADVRPLRDVLLRPLRLPVLSLSIAGVLVFLVVCTNVMSLLLSRLQARRSELWTRTALGATPVRLIRQLATETMALFLLAAPGALLLAEATLSRFQEFQSGKGIQSPTGLPLDGAAFAVFLAASLLCGVSVSTVVALSASGANLQSGLKQNAAGASVSRLQKRFRSGLVVAQVTVALALLSGTGLALEAHQKLALMPLGFDAQGVTATSVLAVADKFNDPARLEAFYDELLHRIEAEPGVQSAALNNVFPSYIYEASRFRIEGQTEEGTHPLLDNHERVTPRYFETLGIPLLAGRVFTDSDDRDAAPAILISESVARAYFAGHDPVGRRIQLHGESVWRRIVGVVADVRSAGLKGSPILTAYIPYSQSPFNVMVVLTRSARPRRMASELPPLVRSLDPEIGISKSWLLSDGVPWHMGDPSAPSTPLGAIALIVLVLATLGIHSHTTFLVGQRAREMGIRLALGSPPARVLWLAAASGLRVVGLGLVWGAVLTLILGLLIAQYVPAASAFSVPVFATALAVLATSGVLACLLPAYKTIRISPAIALRYE